MGRLAGNVRQFAGDTRGLVPMRAGGGRNQGASQLYGRRSLLSQTFAIGALMLPNVAWAKYLKPTGGHSQRPAPCAPAASAPNAGTPSGGFIGARDVGANARARALRQCAVSIS